MITNKTISAHAKWILCGEHAVVRGKTALVFPLKTYTLSLNSAPSDALQVTSSSGEPSPLTEALLQKVGHHLNQEIATLKEHITLNNTIPMGKGLGFSSALCVAAAKWACQKGWLPLDAITTFAHQLEHDFHGKSSGVDIVGSLANEPTLYQPNHAPTSLKPTWQPCFVLIDTGCQSLTKEAVQQVDTWYHQNPLAGYQIDEDMAKSVSMAKEALVHPQRDAALPQLIEAIDMAESCFQKWGLIPPIIDKTINQLKRQGALAAKPTGAGLGGLLISLWQEPPSHEVLEGYPWHCIID